MDKRDLLIQIAKDFSGDRKTKVAAGIFNEGGVTAYGVNHLPVVIPEEDIVNRTELFYSTVTHAEIDLCNKVGYDLKGKTVYVTLFPCNNCATALIKAGVKHVVAFEDRPTASYIIEAKRLFDEAGVIYEVVA